MKHLGDITKINGAEIEPVDCITAGSPCQDLSVAGQRAGLDGERSGLFMEQIRIIKEMRENDRNNGRTDADARPRYMVWENVPGAFSSNKGEDFRCVLEETARVTDESAVIPGPPNGKWTKAGTIMGDGWSIAWRVHDAQYWGVPQRRKRISLVADFGGGSAPEVLFEREGLSRDPAESERTRKRDAGDLEKRTGSASGIKEPAVTLEPGIAAREGGHIYEGVSGTLRGTPGDNLMSVCYSVEFEVAKRRFPVDKEKLKKILREHKTMSNKEIAEELKQPLTLVEHWFREDVHFAIPKPEIWPKLKILLNITTDEFDKAITEFEHCGGTYDMRNRIWDGDVYPTLTQGNKDYMIQKKTCLSIENHSGDSRVQPSKGNKVQSLTSSMGTGGGNVPFVIVDNDDETKNEVKHIIRKLTPLECERLQGYPDGWTDIGPWTDSKGKLHKESSDTARYKALGNSIALPYWFWLLRRISAQYERPATLGSLFDGIGGFPLCWERSNGPGTARWASEIEEFPIAVTRRRFG